MFSVLDMFTIGGRVPLPRIPVGPMAAAYAFSSSLQQKHGAESCYARQNHAVRSLALTGLGHGTDRAVMAGLEGNVPATVDTDHMLHIRETCALDNTLNLAGAKRIHFRFMTMT